MSTETPKILIRSYNLNIDEAIDEFAPDSYKEGLYNLVDTVNPIIAHHEIVFVNPDGQEICLNGEAWNRRTAETNITAFFEESTLRASVTNTGMKHSGMELIAQGVAWEGSVEEWEKMYINSAEIVSFINEQNLDYHPFGIISEGQNSNSVVSTVLEGLKLNYPPEIQDINAPGSDRILLPSEPLILQKSDSQGWNTESLRNYAEILVLSMDKEMVRDQVRQDAVLEKPAVHMFDPNNFMPLQAESVLRAKSAFDVEPQQNYFRANTNSDVLVENAVIRFSHTDNSLLHVETLSPLAHSNNLEKLSERSGIPWVSHNRGQSDNIALMLVESSKDQESAQYFFEKFEFNSIVTGKVGDLYVIGVSLDEVEHLSDDEITILSDALKQNFHDGNIIEQGKTFSPSYDYNSRAVIPGIM